LNRGKDRNGGQILLVRTGEEVNLGKDRKGFQILLIRTGQEVE